MMIEKIHNILFCTGIKTRTIKNNYGSGKRSLCRICMGKLQSYIGGSLFDIICLKCCQVADGIDGLNEFFVFSDYACIDFFKTTAIFYKKKDGRKCSYLIMSLEDGFFEIIIDEQEKNSPLS